ncbi:D-3-phosphoglycerate dehydrogenase [Rhodococcus sp. 27YEA15]|uniref:NAD(P)-dependent oxidoreductase n=1 Tax=Rhodococcus sp. 27YEA15 TaxID=3156259 RepID=UPI003C79DE00
MSSGTVLVTSRSFSSGSLDLTAALESAGLNVVRGPADHNLEALAPALADAVAWIAGTGPVTAEHLQRAPHLRHIARYGVGVDAVDLGDAGNRDILVTNTPGANSDAVADHTIALILAALRGVASGDRGVRTGDWRVTRTRELGTLTVGIIGLGRIGRGVAARLSGFGTKVVGFDPWVPAEQMRELGIEPVDFGDIAQRADIVSLHTPGDQVIIDSKWLDRIPAGRILVNTARANLVDENALADALRTRHVLAYAADSLSVESGQGESPLLAEDLAAWTIFTPHSAAQTVEAVDNMGGAATEAVLAVLRGETPENVVRIPA